MQLKLDENGNVVVEDGKPVYVHDDGREVAFDAPGTVATISRLNGEAKSHRERAEAAEADLKAFEGIDDPEAARKAVDAIKNIDAKKLVDAGEVETIKAEAVKAYEEKLAQTSKAHAEEVKKLQAERDAIREQYHGEAIGTRFSASKFIADKTILPGPAALKIFGEHFKVEDGRPVAYDGAGNKIYSRSQPGEVAEFEEAIETLIGAYPYKDQILKGTGGGTGARPSNGGGGQKTMTRAEYEADPAAGAAKLTEGYALTE